RARERALDARAGKGGIMLNFLRIIPPEPRNGGRTHPFHHQARCRRPERDRRDLLPFREGGPQDRRGADGAPVACRGRGLLRGAQGAAVLPRPGRVHDLGPGDDPGAGRRGRDRAQSRADGRDRPEEGGEGHDSRRLRGVDRRQCGARLGRGRDRPRRGRVFLPRAQRLFALTREADVVQAAREPLTAAPVANLLDFDPAGLAAWMAARGDKPFRAKQVSRWVHQRFAADFAAMTDLARDARAALAAQATIAAPAVIRDSTAHDGTRKWLLDAGNGNAVEAVYIPEDDRGTLCISSQAGCALDCAFCSTGHGGFNRNLATAEIVGQLWHANRALLDDGVGAPWVEAGRAPITNVVMMGMGEPLANFEPVARALRLFVDDNAYGLSRRRVTLSTSGIVPMIDRLAREAPVALAVSLHAPDDALRDRLVPINRVHPLD